MRLLLLTNEDIASCVATNRLLGRLPHHHWRIMLSQRVGKADKRPHALKRLACAEQEVFYRQLFPTLPAIPDKPQQLLTFAQFAVKGIRVEPVTDINAAQTCQAVQDWQPDLVLSIRFGQILQPAFINIAKDGVLNLHSGILPDYRGVMATFWAMLQHQDRAGMTLHFIEDSGIDSGRIIATTDMALDYRRSYLANTLALYPDGVDRMISTVQALAQGEDLTVQSPPTHKGQYFTFPDQQQLAAFHQQGRRLFDIQDIETLAGAFGQSLDAPMRDLLQSNR